MDVHRCLTMLGCQESRSEVTLAPKTTFKNRQIYKYRKDDDPWKISKVSCGTE
jgi:hypothetical protein